MVSGVEDIEYAFAQGVRNDKAVIVEEEAVLLKHLVPHLPVGATFRWVVGRTATESQDHVGVFRLRGAGHGDVIC